MHVTEEVSHNKTSAPFLLVSLAMWRAFLDLSKTEFKYFAWGSILGEQAEQGRMYTYQR